jgi:hypothetical protein
VPAPGAKAQVWTLTCDPTGGDHPAAAQSCALLNADATKGVDPFAPVRKGIMCTMIDAGPQVSTVTGTWRGRQVDTSFDRKNGCQTARWDHASPLVGGKIIKP